MAEYKADDGYVGQDIFTCYRVNGWASPITTEPVVVSLTILVPDSDKLEAGQLVGHGGGPVLGKKKAIPSH